MQVTDKQTKNLELKVLVHFYFIRVELSECGPGQRGVPAWSCVSAGRCLVSWRSHPTAGSTGGAAGGNRAPAGWPTPSADTEGILGRMETDDSVTQAS